MTEKWGRGDVFVTPCGIVRIATEDGAFNVKEARHYDSGYMLDKVPSEHFALTNQELCEAIMLYWRSKHE